MVELKGSLTGIGLVAILQLIGEVHHSGNLELSKSNVTGTLAFDDGRLVAAECGEHHGLQALASCVLELSDADFTFVEGIPTLERTLDLGPAELRQLLDRIASGDVEQLANGVVPDNAAEVGAETICPLLGFADDGARHYSRPTALHRCYAGGAPNLVSVQQQRDLCLAGRFASCPRYRTADAARPTPVKNEPVRPTSAVVERSTPQAFAAPATTHDAATAPEVPPGVAARMTAASQMRLSPAGARDGNPDNSEPNPLSSLATEPRRPSRTFALIVGGAALGFLLVGLITLVVLPALRPDPAPAPTAGVAFEPIAQATRADAIPPPIATPLVAETPAALSRPTSPPPTPTSVSRAATPTPLALATAIAPALRSLVDVRFVLGPSRDWLDNPPFAVWSDGAYRFQARDAEHFVAVGVPIDQAVSDVIVSATFRKTGGPPGGGYGLIVRDQGPEPRDGVNQEMNAYVFETGDLGEYGVWRRDGDHWVDLVPWARSSSVRSGGSPNDLTVRAVGDQLIFSVNGADVATIHDDALDAGGVGLFIGGDYNEVALDRFSVQLPN
jgi:hypothetical protein